MELLLTLILTVFIINTILALVFCRKILLMIDINSGSLLMSVLAMPTVYGVSVPALIGWLFLPTFALKVQSTYLVMKKIRETVPCDIATFIENSLIFINRIKDAINREFWVVGDSLVTRDKQNELLAEFCVLALTKPESRSIVQHVTILNSYSATSRILKIIRGQLEEIEKEPLFQSTVSSLEHGKDSFVWLLLNSSLRNAKKDDLSRFYNSNRGLILSYEELKQLTN